MEVEELRKKWTGRQIYNPTVATSLHQLGYNDLFTQTNTSYFLFYTDNYIFKQRMAFSFFDDIELEFGNYRKSFGPWWKSFNTVLGLKKEYFVPKQAYNVEGPTTWVKEEYQNKWINCWAYDMNSAYQAAASDMLPDWENEIEFPGYVEEGQCGFVVDCGYLRLVEVGEKAVIRFPLKKSPLRPWFEKVNRQERAAKNKKDKAEVMNLKLKRNSVIGVLRNHNVFVWLYIIEQAKKNVMKYVDKDTIAVNIDCIYSTKPRTDIPISKEIGEFKEVEESGNEIYFRETNYAWRNREGKQFSPHMRGVPKILQETYNIETGEQTRHPDYIFNEKGEIVKWTERQESL